MIGILKPAESYCRHFVVWGDHSSILNSGYLLYTTKVIYSTKIFYTDEEMFERTGRVIDVQSLVEQPEIYIVAQCNDSIAEKMSFVSERRDDILKMGSSLTIDDVIVNDEMRFFQGKFISGRVTRLCLQKTFYA